MTLATAATARNYLPRQRYRLSCQIARRVSRHLVVPLLSFLIRRRDKRGRAGPGRAVPFRTSPSRHDRFSHRSATRYYSLVGTLCGDERDRYACRSVAARLNETERETRGAIFFDHLTDRHELSSNSRLGTAVAWLVSFRSFSFAASVKRAKTPTPIGVAQPVIFNEFLPLIRFPGKNLCSRNVDSEYIGEILTFPFEPSVFSQRVLNFCFDYKS